MVELSGPVASLVRTARAETDPRRLRGSVEEVLEAFDAAKPAAQNAAVRALGRALAKAEGTGAQVLCLALGALVEAGGSPELAWPGVSKDLTALLGLATRFAATALRRAKVEHVDAALEAVGAELAKKLPREAAAWKALPSRALTAVSCLIRSKKVRKKGRASDIITAGWALSDVIPEVGYLIHAVRIVDGERLLVLAPQRGRGWRFAVEGIASNADLTILIADALSGGRGVPGARPDAAAVKAIREGTMAKRPKSAAVSFELVAWGEQSPIALDGPFDELPAPSAERVVIVHELPRPQRIVALPSFEALRPEVRLHAKLDAGQVMRVLTKLQTPKPRRRRRRP